VQFIARVQGSYGVHFVRVAGARFETNVRPRPPVGSLITITFEGLKGAVNSESLELWRDRHGAAGEIDRRFYRPTSLADLMTAVNAEEFVAIARDTSADELTSFALDRGGVLLAAIRAELAGANDPGAVTAHVNQFARILDVPDAAEMLSQFAELHAVEHLMALEHAVVSWMRFEPFDNLSVLARQLPDDGISAGVSVAWHQWWWRLARGCTRGALRAIVTNIVELAHDECRHGTKAEVAREACDEATRMVERARVATRAEMWSTVPHAMPLSEIQRDENDAHYASYMALTHAAHAIAAAMRSTVSASEANRLAMQLIAGRALALLR
jgi:hypothetical protein